LFGGEDAADNIRLMNQLGVTPTIIDSFSGSKDPSKRIHHTEYRVVIYNFEVGKTVLQFMKEKGVGVESDDFQSILGKLRSFGEKFRATNLYPLAGDPDDYLIIPSGELVLTDTNRIVMEYVDEDTERYVSRGLAKLTCEARMIWQYSF
jgi:hypothetical protein